MDRSCNEVYCRGRSDLLRARLDDRQACRFRRRIRHRTRCLRFSSHGRVSQLRLPDSQRRLGSITRKDYWFRFPSLSAPDIKGFSVLKPSKGILEAYEHMTRPLIQRIQQNHHQSRTLAALRDTLLPKLLSGALRVSKLPRDLNHVT